MACTRTNRRRDDFERAILDALESPQSVRELWHVLGVQFGGSKGARAVFNALVTDGTVKRYGVRSTFDTGPEPLFIRQKSG